jgi:hypothetical protein
VEQLRIRIARTGLSDRDRMRIDNGVVNPKALYDICPSLDKTTMYHDSV